MEASPEDRAKLAKALAEGRVEFSPAAAEAMANIDFKNPDFTITGVQLEFWGPWERVIDGEKYGNSGGMHINWQSVSGGNGTLKLHIDPETKKLQADPQCMGKKFCLSLFKYIIDNWEEEKWDED